MTPQTEGDRLAALLAWWSAERTGQPLTAEEYEHLRASSADGADSTATEDEGAGEGSAVRAATREGSG